MLEAYATPDPVALLPNKDRIVGARNTKRIVALGLDFENCLPRRQALHVGDPIDRLARSQLSNRGELVTIDQADVAVAE